MRASMALCGKVAAEGEEFSVYNDRGFKAPLILEHFLCAKPVYIMPACPGPAAAHKYTQR